MSFREKIFIDKLFKDAKITLSRILKNRRSTFWGETPVLFRVRKYKVAGEVRNERVSVVKPQLHRVKLYSLLMGKQVVLQTTPQMLRFIEASGGLDDYLLNTPDEKLQSDIASKLKVKLMQIQQERGPNASVVASSGQRREGSGEAEGRQGSRPERTKLSPEQIAEMRRVREQLAVERKERITRMLQAAATAGSGTSSSKDFMS